MKIQKQIYYFVLISFSILIANFTWPLINLTNNNKDIIGVYSQNNYSSFNDILRYLSFILTPVIIYFFTKFFFEKKTFNTFLSNFKIKKIIHHQGITIYIFLLILIIFLILEFLSLNFPLNKIDIFHDGQRLSSAFKSKIDGSLWSGSYVSVGIVYETLGTKLAWKFFQSETIGSMKILDILYILITKILLIFLAFEITKYIHLSNPYKILYFLLTSFILLSIIDYSGDVISFREMPIILSLILFIKTFDSESVINYFLIALLSVLTFFWSIDRALVLILFILFIIFIQIYNKKYKQFFALILSIVFLWVLFFLFFNYEFNFFLSNTLSIIKEHSYVNGIIHPLPFTDEKNSARATKNLLAIIFAIIISLSLFFKNDDKYSHKIKIIFFSISIFCFLSYVYALGRSDGPHIKQAFGFPALFFIFYFLFNFIYFISNSKYNFFKDKKILILILPTLIFFFYFMSIDFKNINTFKVRFNKYISLDDGKFLSDDDNLFIKTVSKVVEKEKCIQLFTNDAALLYLLKKPSCTKYYFVYSMGSISNQKIMINEMKNTNLIILNGKTDNWDIPVKIKYPLVYDYIDKSYIDYKKVGQRLLKIKKN